LLPHAFPGCQGVQVINPTAKIRLQVGSDQADFNVDAEIVSETAVEEVRSRTHGEERSSASSLTTENTLRLTKRERR
jgi:carbon monoxide dehydrogenase subunit G